MIYSDETIYENALLYYKSSTKTQNEVSEIEKKVHNFFFNGIVYHRFDKVKQIYETILGITFPNTEGLNDFLRKRNNIVHRYSLSNIDRMRVYKITIEDIKNLITESNAFVDKLIYNVNKIYK